MPPRPRVPASSSPPPPLPRSPAPGSPAPPLARSPAQEYVDRLALAYQGGDRAVLGELYRALEAVIASAVRLVSAQGLPGTLEVLDLCQQSWLILADLARRWRPERGVFAAYVNTSMAWMLGRYVRRYIPDRRTHRVKMVDVGGEKLEQLLQAQPGEDGRVWDDRLVYQEMLERLPNLERSAFTQCTLERDPLPAVASRLGIARRTVRRLVARARVTLQHDGPTDPAGEDADDPLAYDRDDLVILVNALHAGASPTGKLPGRIWICARTRLTQSRYAELMDRLVASGCVRDRSTRRSGWLVEPDPEATLRRAAGG